MPPKTFAEAPPSPTELRAPTYVIPVKATKRELLKGLRYHVARMISKDNVDITNPEEYERPIKLHRKDPRFQTNGSAMDVDSKEDLIDDKQREQLEAAKAERQRIREEQAKQMAPAASQKRKPQAFKKKVEQVFRPDDTPEERKRQQLRYEEALPWHLEDFEEKKIWQGAYEAALSECHVMLMRQQDGTFRMVPLEKWYRFRQKATQKEHVDPDEAEKQMAKGQRAPRWLLKNEAQERKIKMEEQRFQSRGLFARSGDKMETRVTNGMDFGDQPEVAEDANDIDFDVQEDFADDEENELFEGDDDTKRLAEEKLKRDQLNANVFDMKDEKEVDDEEEQQKLLAEVTKRLEKSTRKALLKREKNYDYATDSDGENPYSSEVSQASILDIFNAKTCSERE
jgi:transcription initiation factor TFIIF subunit alpha